jgi:hypothetical protein
MPKTDPTTWFAAENVEVFAAPFPHALIDPFLPESVFEVLAATWPSGALYPVPAERALASPRRRHLWLNEIDRIGGINSAWLEIASIFGSAKFREGVLDVLAQCGYTSTNNITCISRMCEEKLPYRLERHRDRTEKILSLIWYIDGGPGQNLGTVLYGETENKAVRSKANSALLLPNTKDSYHGGTWSEPEGFFRRTVQLFAVDVNPVGPAVAMPSGRD